jgi:putative hemolysin
MDFRKKQTRHVMVPRTDILALSDEDPTEVNLGIMRSHKFSRYPVYHSTIDNVVGIVHTKDIFKHNRHLEQSFRLESVYRDVTFLPETASLQRALDTMLQKKTHMIMLGDEYGGTAGLVTLEDILEEIVGTIQDEFDREQPEVVRVSDTEFVVDGAVTTNEVERLLDLELSGKDIFSIGGFVIEQLGHIPVKGEVLQMPQAEFIVERVEENAVWSVRVRKVTPAIAPDDAADQEEGT